MIVATALTAPISARAIPSRADQSRPLRVLAARSALAVALMGAVNAVATLTGCLAAR